HSVRFAELALSAVPDSDSFTRIDIWVRCPNFASAGVEDNAADCLASLLRHFLRSAGRVKHSVSSTDPPNLPRASHSDRLSERWTPSHPPRRLARDPTL
ncbi:hypothetical protein, partial [Roseiconus lacunae]